MAKNYRLSEEEKEKAKNLLKEFNERKEEQTIRKEDVPSKNNNVSLNNDTKVNNKIPSYRESTFNLSQAITTNPEKLPSSVAEELKMISPEYRKVKEVNEEIEKRWLSCNKCKDCQCCTEFPRGGSTRNCRIG